MSRRRIEIEPELIAKARQLFEQGDTPKREIAAMLGVSESTLNSRIRQWQWVAPPARLHRRAGRRAAVATLSERPAPISTPGGPMSPDRRAALVERIQGVVECEMTAIERMLDKAGVSDKTAVATGARALAVVARTLREVVALNKPPEVTAPDDADNDPVPRDIDEFRRVLARRIEAFIASRQNGDTGLCDAGEPPLDA